MKFGKELRARVDESYETWQPMFMNYKLLKKCIHPLVDRPKAQHPDAESPTGSRDSEDQKSEPQSPHSPPSPHSPHSPQSEPRQNLETVRRAESHHSHFFTVLRSEVDKVNDFFLEKQEDFIIEHAQLSAKVDDLLHTPAAATRPQLNRLKQRLVAFHGELVLLESFSTVNYTGFRKILKKHDKKTGLNIRHLYLKTVLCTPFFLSDTVRKFILKTEAQLSQLSTVHKFRRTVAPPSSSHAPLPLPSSLPLSSTSLKPNGAMSLTRDGHCVSATLLPFAVPRLFQTGALNVERELGQPSPPSSHQSRDAVTHSPTCATP